MTATPKHFLAIDLGASSGRAIIGRVEAERIGLEEVHRFSNGGTTVNGSLHWNLLGLFAEIKSGIRAALDRGIELNGIAIDTWGVDFGLLDRTGRFVGFPYHYRDSRTDNAFDWAFAKVPQERIYAQTGNQFMTINTLFQLAVMVRNNDPALDIAERLLLMPNALTYMLCGDVSTEYSAATTTQAYNPVVRDWAWEVIDGFGIPRHIFPEVKPSCTVVGKLTDDLCHELNCTPIPVILTGGHDTASAVAAIPVADCGRDDWAFLSSGTWSLLGCELDTPLITPAAQAANFTNEGTITGKIRFLKNIMGLWLIQECRAQWGRKGKTLSFNELGDMAARAPAFQSFINPNDASFVAPGDMPARIRDFCRRTNQPVPTEPGAIIRCALESLALCYRLVLEQLEAVTGRSINRLYLVGGGCKDTQLNQFTANAINRPVTTGPVEATATGNIIGQALATGLFQDQDRARQAVRQSFDLAEYQPQDSDVWDRALVRFREIAE